MARGSLFFSSGVAGYAVQNSCIFNGTDEDMTRTHTAADRKLWSFSTWIKRGAIGSDDYILSTYNGSWPAFGMRYLAANTIEIFDYNSSYDIRMITTQTFTSTSTWDHILLTANTASATAADRIRLYYNSAEVTSYTTETNPAQNFDTHVNTNVLHTIGSQNGTAHLNCKLAETYFITGVEATPSDFVSGGSPIEFTGTTTGTNTFKHDYQNSGALGEDAINSNDWATTNMDSGNQSTDVPA